MIDETPIRVEALGEKVVPRNERYRYTATAAGGLHTPLKILLGLGRFRRHPGGGNRARRGAQLLEITGRDHMKAVGDARFRQGVLDFLTERP